MAKRHKLPRTHGWKLVVHLTDRMGLINLDGSVVAPRPNRDRRVPTERNL